MDKGPVKPPAILYPYFPDQYALKQLAGQMEHLLGKKLEAKIEADNRYIICSEGNAPILYLRLRLWWDPQKSEKGLGWAKVDYFVLTPTFRCQGWGRKLVHLIKAWIEAQKNLDFICLYARPEVAPFWAKCGFKRKPNQGGMLYQKSSEGPCLT